MRIDGHLSSEKIQVVFKACSWQRSDCSAFVRSLELNNLPRACYNNKPGIGLTGTF